MTESRNFYGMFNHLNRRFQTIIVRNKRFEIFCLISSKIILFYWGANKDLKASSRNYVLLGGLLSPSIAMVIDSILETALGISILII